MERSEHWDDYKSIVESILDAIHFMESFGGANKDSLGRIEFFTSHEGLHLDYESALTRLDGESFYNLGAHLLWIGERTRALDEAHVEYFRGIANPIAVKIGRDAAEAKVVELCRTLNPNNRPGKLCLISRMGAKAVDEALPPIIEAVQASGSPVAWMCDPMHGNTVAVRAGSGPAATRKTRRFHDVLQELTKTFEVHREAGTTLAGVHFELTGEDVTECLGGALDLEEEDLGLNYQSWCDPRLNYSQSMEMAFLISRLLRL